jgi:signal transduction histidine kinase
VESIRRRIDEVYGPREASPSEISLHDFVAKRLEELRPRFAHQQVEIATNLQTAPAICVPVDVLQKVVDGLVRNGIEATPDGGRMEVIVQRKAGGAELVVIDCGIGITEENKLRIFEGFFTTQETMAYSSKRPFDFNAGGKGADLLRMKIFAERYGFQITMCSSRCPHLPKDGDLCPGDINRCGFCRVKEDCYGSGGTSFFVYFPAAPQDGCGGKRADA